MPDNRARMLELLAEDHQTERDYDDIERAKAIVEEVNDRIRKQGSCTKYSVTFASGPWNLIWGDDAASR